MLLRCTGSKRTTHQTVRGSFSLSDGHDRREKVNSRAAVNWTEPDRCRWQRKGGRLSEETRRVASRARRTADVSDRWCRQFEPDRSSHPHRSKMQPMPKSLVLQGFFDFLGQFFWPFVFCNFFRAFGTWTHDIFAHLKISRFSDII